MSKTKKVLYNTLTAALNMIVVQIVSLVVSVKVLEVYGPDFHGLNSILSNVMTWILLIEAGLTTATTVSLYKPYMHKEYDVCNQILSASRILFSRIGAMIFVIGAFIAFAYPFVITSEIPYWDICLMFLIMSFSTSFGIFYTRKYGVMYSVTQNEYVNQLITIFISVLGSVLIYILAISGAHYLWVRTVYMFVTLVTGVTIAAVIKRKYKFLDYHAIPDYSSIKGTKDVFMQKLTGVIRNSAPAIFISMFDTTVAASIYAVNMYGYNFIRSIMQNVLTATQSGIGQVVAEKNGDAVYRIFRSFEYVMVSILMWLTFSAIAITIPFIHIYTKNVDGVNYVNYLLWLMIPLNYAVQVCHLPSGVLINMYAKFKEDKQFQIYSSIIMILAMLVAGAIWKLNGIVLGATVGSLALAFQEIKYARENLLHKGYKDLLKPILCDMLILAPLLYIEYLLIPQKISIPLFFSIGFVVLVVNGVALLLGNLLYERERLLEVFNRFSKIIIKK